MRGLALGLGVVATLAAGEAAAQPAGPPSPAARVSLLVERFTGPVDRHCGILPPPDSDGALQGASRRDVMSALRCVLRARRDGRPTWALWELRGLDSTLFAGLAVSGRSDVHVVRYDSIGTAGGAVMTPCFRPRVAKDGTIACRNALDSLVDTDLDRVLTGLERDARRASGAAGAQAMSQARTAATAAPANQDDARIKAALVTAAQAMQRLTGAPWPACPYHHDHPLQVHDRYWVCGRDGIFVGELGKLAKQPRARPLR